MEVKKQVIFPGTVSIIIFSLLFFIVRASYQEQYDVTKKEILGIEHSSIHQTEDDKFSHADKFSLFLERQRDVSFLISIVINTIPESLKNINNLKTIREDILQGIQKQEYYKYIVDNNTEEFLNNADNILRVLGKMKTTEIQPLYESLEAIVSEFTSLQKTLLNSFDVINKENSSDYFLKLSKVDTSLNDFYLQTKELLLTKLRTREESIGYKLHYGTLLYVIVIILTLLVMQRNFYKSKKLVREVDKKKSDDKYIATLKETLLTSSSLKTVCEMSIFQLVKKFGAVSGILYIYDDNNYKLYLGGTFGIDPKDVDATLSLHDNLIGDCIIDHKLKITHSNLDLHNGTEIIKVNELVSIPLVNLDKSIGAVQLYFSDCFDYCEMNFLKRVVYIMSNNIYQSDQDNQTEHYLKLIDRNIMVIKTDLNGDIIDVSEEFCNLSGFSKEELVGSNHRMFKDPETPDSLYRELWDSIRKGVVWRGEIKNITKSGGYYWAENIIAPNFDLNGNIIGFTGIKHDITSKKLVEELSITDALTNLHNRRYFDEVFPNQLQIAHREGKKIALAIIDVDFFKQYNDIYGHQEGDKTLIAVSKTIESLMYRPNDYCFRIGGEEFAMLYFYKTKENAIEFSNKIRQAVEDLKIPHSEHNSSSYVTISIGVKLLEAEEIKDADHTFRGADEALYAAKNAGRNRVVAL